jgi:hypothetical protein
MATFNPKIAAAPAVPAAKAPAPQSISPSSSQGTKPPAPQSSGSQPPASQPPSQKQKEYVFSKFIKEIRLADVSPGVSLSIGGILQILSSLSPLLLSMFFIISSLSNGNLKWVMYLAGFIVLLFVFSIAAFTTNKKFDNRDDRGSPYWKKECNFVALPFGLSEFMIPNFNSAALGFIFAYIFMPMLQYSSYNVIMLSIILVFFFTDAVSKVLYGCTPVVGVIIGLAIGWIVGYMWYLFVSAANNEMIYFNVENGASICSRPNKQTFKCKVYKNGEVIHTM